jgi:hypothetical protein
MIMKVSEQFIFNDECSAINPLAWPSISIFLRYENLCTSGARGSSRDFLVVAFLIVSLVSSVLSVLFLLYFNVCSDLYTDLT